MSNPIRIICALAAGAALVPWATAQATVTYTRSLDTRAGYDVVSTTTPGTYTWSTPVLSATTSASPDQNGTAETTFSVTSGTFAVGQSISYVINLAGPANLLVPVRITADGYVQVFGTQSDSATVDFQMFSAAQNPLVDAFATVQGASAISAGFAQNVLHFDQVVYVLANTDLYVSLIAGGGSFDLTHFPTVSGHAFIDPQFIVDPAYASQYAFVGLPDGAAPQPPESTVPEPASVALLALGGGLIGFTKSRRGRSGGALPGRQMS